MLFRFFKISIGNYSGADKPGKLKSNKKTTLKYVPGLRFERKYTDVVINFVTLVRLVYTFF